MGAFPLRHLGPRRRLPNQSGGRKINTWRLLGTYREDAAASRRLLLSTENFLL